MARRDSSRPHSGRRRGPRELAHAVSALRSELAPPSLLAEVQERWRAAVGERVAAQAEPVAERRGVVTVSCRSAVWAAELNLLAPQLQRALNEALGGGRSIGGLRFVTRPS
jgi:predicted nucleic acid-binding Zn ribbon protein